MAKKRANGEGNIRKRKDGRWEGRYTAGYDEKTGKRIIKSVLGKTQAEVKEKLAKAVAEAENVDVRRADEYTLGTWLQTWYELYAKPHLRFSTAEYYRRGIELHIVPRIGDIPLKKLTGRDLQWLYKDLQEHGRLREAQKGKQAGRNNAGEPDITRPKTENSIRKISIPQDAVDLLIAEHQKHPGKQSGCAPHGGASEEAFCFLRFFFQDKICQRLPCLPLAFRREVRTARKQLCIYREKQLASCLLKNIRFTAPDTQPESG